MLKIKTACFAICLVLGASSVFADAQKELKAYPQAEANYDRQVIFLPTLDNENDAKVELMVGKTLDSDCNTRSFVGRIEEKVVQGWGYNYYHVDQINGPISTMMACPDKKTQKRFIWINGTQLQRYNSKLPIVVYVPKGYEVRYRVWQASANIKSAKKQ